MVSSEFVKAVFPQGNRRSGRATVVPARATVIPAGQPSFRQKPEARTLGSRPALFPQDFLDSGFRRNDGGRE